MKDLIKEILRDYEKTRLYNSRRKDEKIKEVHSKYPKIKEIDNNLKKISINIVKSIFSDTESKKIKYLREEYSNLKALKTQIILDNNIDPNYNKDIFSCETCEDTGYTKSNNKCKCFNQKLINNAYNISNMSNILEKENFQTFNLNIFSNNPYEDYPLTPRENIKNILSNSEGFVQNFEDPNEKSLLFIGPTGLGKTFLTNCIAKSLLDSGYIVFYQTAFSIMKILEDLTFRNENNKSFQQNSEYNLLFNADLLIIDDLGTELTNSFTNSSLFNILNTRLLNNKKVLISTNLSVDDLSIRYDDRIFSRLMSYFEPYKFYGEDLRWEN